MCAFNNMERVICHVRKVWSYGGLEVQGSSERSVNASVGPDFPVSDFCADMADTFDAVVVLRQSAEHGTSLVVHMGAEPGSEGPRPRLIPVTLLLVACAAAACAKLHSKWLYDVMSIGSV